MCMLYLMFFSTTQCACCTTNSSQRPIVHVVPHLFFNDPMCMLYHMFVSTTQCACCTTCSSQRPNVHVVPHVRLNDPMCMLYHMFFSTTQCACCTSCSSQRPNKVRARRVSCSACCIMRKVQTFLTSKDAFLVLLTPTPCRWGLIFLSVFLLACHKCYDSCCNGPRDKHRMHACTSNASIAVVMAQKMNRMHARKSNAR